MRILVVSNLYPPHAIGGYELACADVARRWRRAGHEVKVLTSRVRLPNVVATEWEPDVSRKLTLHTNGPWGSVPTRRGRSAALVARDHAVLARTLRQVRPDVVSVWHPGGLALSLISRLVRGVSPLVFVVCDYWPQYASDLDPTLRWAERIGWGLPDLDSAGTAAFCSEALRQRLRAETVWSFPRSEIVWLGVDLEVFPLVRPVARPFSWRLLYVGRLSNEKGVATLVRSLAALPEDATLRIVGYGSETETRELLRLAHEQGVAGRLCISAVDRSDLPALYKTADLAVFPSEWPEPFGIVPLEAMACSTPVVASGTGGSAEYLRHGQNCLLFQPGDPTGLAAAVRQLAIDESLRVHLVGNGCDTAARYTIDRTAEALEEIHVGATRHSRGDLGIGDLP